jgi:hypothetical protein
MNIEGVHMSGDARDQLERQARALEGILEELRQIRRALTKSTSPAHSAACYDGELHDGNR